MKISLEWLRDYVELPSGLGIDALMHALTLTTVEVEGAEDLSSTLAHVVVGRVLSCEPLESSANLSLTQCDVGADGPLQILCGAKNVAAGMTVPVAMEGARILPHGKTEPLNVGEITIAGNASRGVVCAAEELRLSALFPDATEGVLDLGQFNACPGTPLAELVGWNDHVLNIDNKSLTNRPDLWGHYGIARELSAIYKLPLAALPDFDLSRVPEAELLAQHFEPGTNRFTATRIEGVNVSRAPFWMRSRLARVEQRSINLLVDLTNYAMLTTGQPCHVYNLDKLALPLGVRRLAEGELCATLDGSVVEGDGRTLAVVDCNGPVALAGMIGGTDPAVLDTTTSTLLEVASFDSVEIRRTSMRLGIRTDASIRFEKSIDTQRVDQARAVFLHLLQQIAPNARLTGQQQYYPNPTPACTIDASVAFLHERLGKALPIEETQQSLALLGIRSEVDAGGELHTEIPSWRATGDISLPHDLVEEVARVHGYDNFSFTPPSVQLQAKAISRQASLERRMREFFAFVGGMREVVSYPWSNDKLINAAGLDAVAVPRISGAPSEQDRLRPSLIPNLLQFTAFNLRNMTRFCMFEIGTAFSLQADGKGIHEDRRIAVVITGESPEDMFRELKGLITNSARVCQFGSITITADCKAPWADPYGCVGLSINTHIGDIYIGDLAVLRTRAMRIAGIKHAQIVACEFSLDQLKVLPSRENRYTLVPEFPHVVNDLSMVMDATIPWAKIHAISAKSHTLIIAVEFVDEFRGKGIAEGQKSITLRLTLGADDRTLGPDDINAAREAVLAALQQLLGAQLRSY
jgi:phenylalanyl-tRNA synthetase beta chain